MTSKQLFAGIILFSFCACAVCRNMQTLAIVSLLLLICIIYLDRVRKAVNKKVFAGIILFSFCACAVWRNMQTFAIVSLLLLICIIYLDRVRKAVNLIFDLIAQTKRAKYKDIELSIGDQYKQEILDCVSTDKKWVKAIIADLSSTPLALFIAISKISDFPITETMKNHLRILRDKGLLKPDTNNIGDANSVSLTPFGLEIAEQLQSLHLINKLDFKFIKIYLLLQHFHYASRSQSAQSVPQQCQHFCF
ncbi:MAG: hypothetical protein ACRYGB_11430 [Janthinobacterium lividum]